MGFLQGFLDNELAFPSQGNPMWYRSCFQGSYLYRTLFKESTNRCYCCCYGKWVLMPFHFISPIRVWLQDAHIKPQSAQMERLGFQIFQLERLNQICLELCLDELGMCLNSHLCHGEIGWWHFKKGIRSTFSKCVLQLTLESKEDYLGFDSMVLDMVMRGALIIDFALT